MGLAATRQEIVDAPVLYMALELGERQWKLGFSTSLGQAPRLRGVAARDLAAVQAEIEAAKRRFGVAQDAPVHSCYEAGRDGFWLHRALVAMGVHNVVVDSSSIEVDRRARRAKSDRLDVVKLLEMLMRHHAGESRGFRVVRVPTPAEEDRRQLHRELETLKRDRTRTINRVKSLLATQGIAAGARGALPHRLDELRIWNGDRLPSGLAVRLAGEVARGHMIEARIRELEHERKRLLRNSPDPAIAVVRKLLKVRGIGIESAWVYAMEFFSWRRFRNVREVSSLAGLVSAPYQSGTIQRDLGITKAGNRHVRALAVEIAWGWLQHQPGSALAQWYQRRFGSAGPVQRRKGIVALARKLLVALWKYVEHGQLPEGAALKA
jgi:transposase